MGITVALYRPLQGDGGDLFRDILPQVALFVSDKIAEGFQIKKNGMVLSTQFLNHPNSATIIYKGIPVDIVRCYNIETNRFLTELYLEGWKAEGTGPEATVENVHEGADSETLRL